MKQRIASLPVFLTAIGLVVPSAFVGAQTTIFNDTFDVGTNPTVGDDIDDPNDTAWTTANDITISVGTDNQLGSGNYLNGNTSGSLNLISTSFASQTLGAVGDSLSISFDYAWQASAGQTGYIPAFGFYDVDDGQGYYGRVDSTQLKIEKENNSEFGFIAGSDFSNLEIYQNNYNYDGGEVRFGLTLTRVAGDGVSISMSIDDLGPEDNDVTFSVTDSSGAYFDFDTFALRSRSTDYYLDNVVLEYSAVPEPSSFALIAGAMASLLMIRRKRR